MSDPADYVYSDPYASDYERGLWDPDTRNPAGPHDEGTRGICGEPAPMLRLLEGVPQPGPPCELLAGHPGWHRAPQVGTSPMHWSPNETMGYDFPPPISPEPSAELKRLRAEVARLSALLDEERRKVERLELQAGSGEVEIDQLRQSSDVLRTKLDEERRKVAEAGVKRLIELNAMRPVVEAAEACYLHGDTDGIFFALLGAVDSYRRSRFADPAGEQGSGT